MAHSCPFDLFILVLCLVACLCAYAAVNEHGAHEAVKKAKESADDVLDKAKREVIRAEDLLKDINTQKSIVEEAKKVAEESAKGNAHAVKIAQKAQSALDGITALNLNALEQANKYIERTKDLRTKASALFNDADNLLSSLKSSTNYRKIKEDADAIKGQAKVLENDITTASSYFVNMVGIKLKISKFVSDARLVKYQVDVIVAVDEFEALLEAAGKNVNLTEKKRDEIDAIEQNMQKLYDNIPSGKISYFSSLHSNIEGNLRTASRAVDDSKTAMEYILKLKQSAANALVKVKSETNDINAKKEVDNVNWAIKGAQKKVEEIKKALEAAEIAAKNALHRQKDLVNEINKNKNKPHDTKGKDKKNTPDSTKTHQPVQNTKEGPTESGKIKPTTINSDESMNEQDMENTTEIPVVSGTRQPTITKPNKSVSGGTDPTRYDQSDSAMTVSVPLLLLLIGCAALN